LSKNISVATQTLLCHPRKPVSERSMPNRMTFAVGDIHGCFDKLRQLLAACESATDDRSARFVFIGDYVDRGPDARKVIALLAELQRQARDRFICLRGNHEEMLARAARSDRTDSDLMMWWANGGEATLDSYGVNDPSDLPAEHLAWIEALPYALRDERRLFVHAGIRPGVPIPEQAERDLLWIREPFLSSNARHGAYVVHGHTPTRSGLPDLRPNRLNIDTGACFGRPLTAALFSDAQTLPLMFINDLGETW
jgi:serine/threonine protein phosphatase 1